MHDLVLRQVTAIFEVIAWTLSGKKWEEFYEAPNWLILKVMRNRRTLQFTFTISSQNHHFSSSNHEHTWGGAFTFLFIYCAIHRLHVYMYLLYIFISHLALPFTYTVGVTSLLLIYCCYHLMFNFHIFYLCVVCKAARASRNRRWFCTSILILI